MNNKYSYTNLKNDTLPKIKQFNQCDISEQFNPNGVKDMMVDFVFPPVIFPPNEIYKNFGKDNIIKMVFYHHNLLKKSSIKDLFTKDEDEFKTMTYRTADFFIEALGGGSTYSSKHGHPHLRARHFTFTVDEHAREVWLMFYKKTLKDINFPKEYLKPFWEWIESLSIRMINRRTTMNPPKRYPFEEVFKNIENNFFKGVSNEK